MFKEIQKIAYDQAKNTNLESSKTEKISTISKKNKKTPAILVLGRDNFSDNSKYTYLGLLRSEKQIPIFWGTFNKELHENLTQRNLPSVYLGGPPSDVISLLLQFSCVVYCTNPAEATRDPLYRAALAGAYKFQLWHGIGKKTLDLQNTSRANLLDTNYLDQLLGAIDIDEVLSPSIHYDEQWREAFGVEKIFRSGYPRNEVLLRPSSEEEEINTPKLSESITNNGFVLYSPTYSSNREEPQWMRESSIIELMKFTSQFGTSLIIKPHPFDAKLISKETTKSTSQSLIIIDPNADIYPILKYANCLITDESSIAYDFMLCNKPIIFYNQGSPAPSIPHPGSYTTGPSQADLNYAWENELKNTGAKKIIKEYFFETPPLSATSEVVDRIIKVACDPMEKKQ